MTDPVYDFNTLAQDYRLVEQAIQYLGPSSVARSGKP